ncbi:MAG: hypothetical protein U0X39_12750 [Bacteroidales bacterium]
MASFLPIFILLFPRKVTKIDAILDLSGYKQTAIVIESEGDDWVDTIDRSGGTRK